MYYRVIKRVFFPTFHISHVLNKNIYAKQFSTFREICIKFAIEEILYSFYIGCKNRIGLKERQFGGGGSLEALSSSFVDDPLSEVKAT